MDAGSVLPKYPGRPKKIGMIFHRVITPDESDEQRVLRQTQLGANVRPGIFRRRECLQLESIRDDRPSMLTKPQAPLVQFSAHRRVSDSSARYRGKPGADPARRGGHKLLHA